MGGSGRSAHSTSALLLRAVDFGEADRIVTLLTPDLGRVSALARGARRSRRRFGGALEPFGLLQVELAETRGELYRLTQATLRHAWRGVLGDLRKMTLGGAALQLLREVTASRHADVELFRVCCQALEGLDRAAQAEEAWWIGFQVRIMALQGFAPRLDACGRCGREPSPGQSACFDPRAGFLVCRACGGTRLRLDASLRLQLLRATGPDWLEATAGWTPQQVALARRVVRAFVEARLERSLAAQPAVAQIDEAAPSHEPSGE